LNFGGTSANCDETGSSSNSVSENGCRLSWKPGVSRQIDQQGCRVDLVCLRCWRRCHSDRCGIHNLDNDRENDLRIRDVAKSVCDVDPKVVRSFKGIVRRRNIYVRRRIAGEPRNTCPSSNVFYAVERIEQAKTRNLLLSWNRIRHRNKLIRIQDVRDCRR